MALSRPRSGLQITLSWAVMTEIRFSDLTLSEPLMSALEEMGYEHPTPVQASAIPMAATGRDLLVQSQTGTGKTAAFCIPLIESLESGKGIGALMLCPTRELAKQVADEFDRLSKFKNMRSVAIYGGASMDKQIAEMRFARVAVGTPGRILDHLRRKTLRLDDLQALVLDEADEMLSRGFAEELHNIMRFVPEERQTLLFSATVPEDIKRYSKRYMKEPEFLSLIEENVAADDVTHNYYMISGVGRCRDLCRVIEYEDPESAIIFTNTRKDTEVVARYLKKKGYDAEFLNGDLPQRTRERVMARTKEKNLRFLVATDIAARGIDISELSHVINYVLPESPEVYIHRTGRTGRAGRKGTAVSLIGPREIGVYYYLKRIYNVALQERTVPTEAEIELQRHEKKTTDAATAILDSLAGQTVAENFLSTAGRLLEREDAIQLVGALLHHFDNRGAAAPKGPVMGGMLEDVPKPARIAPGSRAQTISGVADRVAIIQSEFRGLPKDKKPAATESAPATPSEPTPAKSEPKKAEEPAKAEAAESDTATDDTPKPRRSRRRRRPSAEDAAVEQVETAKEGEPEPASEPEPEPEVHAEPASTPADDDDDALETVRLFLNIGKRDNVKLDTLRETLAEYAGLLPEDLVDIRMLYRHSYVMIDKEFADDLLEAVNGEALGRKVIRIELARND